MCFIMVCNLPDSHSKYASKAYTVNFIRDLFWLFVFQLASIILMLVQYLIRLISIIMYFNVLFHNIRNIKYRYFSTLRKYAQLESNHTWGNCHCNYMHCWPFFPSYCFFEINFIECLPTQTVYFIIFVKAMFCDLISMFGS